MTKRCFRCEAVKPVDEFYKHPQMADGRSGKCKECTKSDVRANYENRREEKSVYERERNQRPERRAAALEYQRRRRQRSPQKNAARAAVNREVKAGRLVPRPCEVCSGLPTQAHHEDYGRPLDVRWLCFEHHREAHGQVVVSNYQAVG